MVTGSIGSRVRSRWRWTWRPRLYSWWKRHGWLSYKRHQATLQERLREKRNEYDRKLEEIHEAARRVMRRAVAVEKEPARDAFQFYIRVAVDGRLLMESEMGGRHKSLVADMVGREVAYKIDRAEFVPTPAPQGPRLAWNRNEDSKPHS